MRNEELQDERGESGEGLAGDLMGEPGEGVGDGLGEEVEGHGREVGPGGVATEKFDESGAEHEAKDEEPGGEAKKCRRGILAGGLGDQTGFFQEDDEEAGLE